MDEYARHQKIWRVLYALAHRFICRKFALRHEDLHVDGPCLVIPNHVTTWDPLLVAMSLREKQVYFVASEHIFRWGAVTKLLNWLVAPIARRKGSTGADTVKAILRHLKAGHSVCLFAEGECTWDGKTGPVFPATGKLAKRCGASLVTYRLEGGYLSLPRWSKKVRRGRMFGHPVGIYPPEVLADMSADEVSAVIDRDLYEDAWARQAEDPAHYRGKRIAEGLEKALYLCPGCHRIGTLRTGDDRLFCDCGMETRYLDTGFFDPPEPFPSVAEWDAWQAEQLRARAFDHGEALFSDGGMTLIRVAADHGEEAAGTGELTQYEDRLVFAGTHFPLDAVSGMAMVQAHLLMFSFQGDYYQIRAENGANLRKYLAVWKQKTGG